VLPEYLFYYCTLDPFTLGVFLEHLSSYRFLRGEVFGASFLILEVCIVLADFSGQVFPCYKFVSFSAG
jgi:hypothetical protein